VGRILQAGLVAAVTLFAAVLLAGPLGLRLGSPSPTVAYNQFEQDVKARLVRQATVDGNVISANYGDRVATVLTPSPDATVALMIKFDVQVEAARAVPASGVNLPVLGAVLLPYAVLAWFVIGMVSAARDGIDIDVSSWEPPAEKTKTAAPPASERPLTPADV